MSAYAGVLYRHTFSGPEIGGAVVGTGVDSHEADEDVANSYRVLGKLCIRTGTEPLQGGFNYQTLTHRF